tara:strand:- start:496 stop:687 length:192 start_codon:yes stop_codon:yes gene_type:complete
VIRGREISHHECDFSNEEVSAYRIVDSDTDEDVKGKFNEMKYLSTYGAGLTLAQNYMLIEMLK